MKILGQCQQYSHLLLTSYHLLLQLNDLLNYLLNPQQPNQVSSRGRGTQRKTSLIGSRGHRGRQTVSTSDILSHEDSQIDRQDTPEPLPSTSGISASCRGGQTHPNGVISSHRDIQIDRQDSPEPSPSISGASRGHAGPQRKVQTVWKWIDTTSGGNYTPIDTPFQRQSGLRCDLQNDAKPIDFFNLYFTDAVIQKSLMKQTGMPMSF